MKKISLLLVLSTVISLNSTAQVHSKKELVQLSLERLFPNDSLKKAKTDMSDLIEKWNEVFDEQNLKRDKNKRRSDWSKAFPIQENRTHHIEGKRTYYSVFPKKYRYDIIEDAQDNDLVVHVKIHFYPSKTYLKRMEKFHAANHPDKKFYPKLEQLFKQVNENVEKSEILWNSQAPQNVRFNFEMVNRASDAHYSIKLVTFFGALYDKFITAPAYSDILAHEIGHMLGLDDEYSPVTSNLLPIHSLAEMMNARYADRDMEFTAYQDMRCNLESIMCLKETLYPYHFDHILGRMKL